MNHLRYLWTLFQSEASYYRREGEVRHRPLVFSLETTSVCNLACRMCPYKDMTRAHVMIEPALFRKVVDEVRDTNGILWLHNLGEPLAHPRFDELIRYVKSQGLPCGMSTNATLLDAGRSRRLIEAGLDKLILCMDGITRETYEALRVGADFEQVTANIERFLALDRGRMEATVQLIYMKDTEDQVEAFRRRWAPLADRVLIKRFATWADQVDGIAELAEDRHRYDPAHSRSGPRQPCAYLWRNVVVTATGDVIPCCMDFDARLVMGNVGEASLEEIWHGEAFRELRRQHLEGDFRGPCRDCLEWVGGPASPRFPFSRTGVERLLGRGQGEP